MASFRIHEDVENVAAGNRKDAEIYTANQQRRALGELNQFACNQKRNIKLTGLTNGPCKVQDENRTLRQIKNEKNIMPPVAQFRAFSVYEDNPSKEEDKKKESTCKPVATKKTGQDNVFVNTSENARGLCVPVEKKPDRPQDLPCARLLKEKDEKEKKEVVASPMSIVDSSVMSISYNESQSFVEDVEDNDVTTAQTDREMFFHVVEYRQDIYQYMREIEVKNRANPNYMRKQPHITQTMRSILIDWLVEVCDEYGLQTETLHLGVSYADRFLSYMSVVSTKLQLVGTAATYIAAKYEEVDPPVVTEFVYITADTYTKRAVLRMENLILKVLSFDLSTPTSLAFLSHYCISNGLSKKTFHLAAYIAELCLLEAVPYLNFKSSVIAACALATARHCLLCECSGVSNTESRLLTKCTLTAWPPALAQCAGLSLAELEPCLREQARTHAHALQQPYQAIPEKYKKTKYESVANIEPRPLFPVPKYKAQTTANARPATEQQ